MNREKFVLITGATSGIGKALAEEFALHSYSLILVSRNVEMLQTMKIELELKHNILVYFYSIDLSNIIEIDKLKDCITTNNLPVNILINNAGAAKYGPVTNTNFHAQENIMNLNMLAVVRMVDLFLPLLKQNKDSKILNVASIVALYPLPYNGVYGATKAFVLSYTKAIRYELQKIGISVCCLCPGDTNTNFFKNAGNENPKRKLISPENVAKQAYVKFFQNTEVIFPSNVSMISKLPRFMLESGIKRIMDKSRKLTTSST